MDTTLYLDVNRLMRATPWAHGIARAYSIIGLALLGLAIVVAALRSAHDLGDAARRRLSAVLWSVAGAVLAFGIAQLIGELVGRQRPYTALQGVVVIVSRVGSFSFPSDDAVVAGAVAAGLWLAHDWFVAVFASLCGLLLCCSEVYVGANYPGDVTVGAVLGAAVVLGGYRLAMPLFGRCLDRLANSPYRGVGPVHAVRRVGPGPAAQPQDMRASGAVRLLSDHTVRPVIPVEEERKPAVGSS